MNAPVRIAVLFVAAYYIITCCADAVPLGRLANQTKGLERSAGSSAKIVGPDKEIIWHRAHGGRQARVGLLASVDIFERKDCLI